MPPAVEAARRPRRRRPLSRELILDRAVVLIERDGPAALSMRRLGRELGVEGMALYHYVAGRDELLLAIGDRLLEPLREVDLTDDWREACRRFATTLRDIARASPATFQLVGLYPFDTPAALQPVERLLTVLIDAGFTPADALGAYRAVASYARGYALAEATGFTVDASLPRGRARLRALPGAEFPVLVGMADELAALDADSGFDVGLRALVGGHPGGH